MATIQDDVVRLEKASGSRKLITTDCVYDLTEDKTQEAVNSEIKNTLIELGNDIATILQDPAQDTFTEGTYVVYNNQLYTVGSGGIPMDTPASSYYPSKLTAVSGGGLNSLKNSINSLVPVFYENSSNHNLNDTLSTVYTYTATKDCVILAQIRESYNEASPKAVELYARDEVVSSGTNFCLGFTKLDYGQSLLFRAASYGAGNNLVHIKYVVFER